METLESFLTTGDLKRSVGICWREKSLDITRNAMAC